MKRLALISGITLLIIVLFVGGVILLKGKKTQPVTNEQPTPTSKKQVITDTPLEARPYVSLIPRADGKELTIMVDNLRDANKIEYELVYLAGDLSRGAIGIIDNNSASAATHKVLLGSCSKNTCKYDENVSVGSLTLRIEYPDGIRKFVSGFHLQTGNVPLTSVDVNMQPDNIFKLEAKLPKPSFFVTMNTVGLPSQLQAKPGSDPYGVFASDSVIVKSAKITLSGDGVLQQWDGKAWTALSDGTATSLGTFVKTSQ